MAITLTGLQEVLAEAAEPLFKQQGVEEAPLYANKWLEHRQYEGMVVEKRLQEGENYDFGFIDDGDTLASTSTGTPGEGSFVDFETYQMQGKIFYGRVKVPRAGASQAKGIKGGVHLVRNQIMKANRTALRSLDLAMINGTSALHTITSGEATAFNASLSTTVSDDITVTNPGRFKPGMGLEVWDSGGSTLRGVLKVEKVTPNFATGTHTVSVLDTGLVSLGTFAANDVVYQRGAKNKGMVGLKDVAGSGDIHGFTPSVLVSEWKGVTHSAIGTLDDDNLRTAITELRVRRGGRGYDFLLMNSENLQRYYETQESKVVFNDLKHGIDAGGVQTVRGFDGKPIYIDENMGSGDILICNKEDVALAVFKDFFQDQDGVPGDGGSAFQIDKDTFHYTAEMWGIFNLDVDRRNGTALLTGITA